MDRRRSFRLANQKVAGTEALEQAIEGSEPDVITGGVSIHRFRYYSMCLLHESLACSSPISDRVTLITEVILVI